MSHSQSIPPPNQPALSPPPGVSADFLSPYTLRPYEALTIVASVVVTTVMVTARMYTKKFIVKAMKWEDYTCFLGWVGFLLLSTGEIIVAKEVPLGYGTLKTTSLPSPLQATFMAYLAVQWLIGTHGGGTHMWNLYYSQVQYQRRYGFYSDPIYSLSLLSTKFSILLLILRIFCSVKRHVGYWLSQALIVVNTTFYAIYFFIPFFQCSPRNKIWISELPGHCLNINALYIASASFNAISDIAMLSVPLYLIWNLQMSLQRKIGVSAVFATGGLACIASILRLIFHVILARTPDFSYVKFQSTLWSMAEIACGLLCSCLVILPRLYQHLASITPYRSTNDPLTTSIYSAGNRNPNHNSLAETSGRRDWIPLKNRNDQDLPSLPRETFQGDKAIDVAVQGRGFEGSMGP